MNDTTQRHALRLQLLQNGYRPLPLLDKGVRIKGWVRDEINEQWLERFRRTAKYANTGVRCDDLIAIDIDVTDESLAEHIENFVLARLGEDALCRVGSWPKRLLLYRCADEDAEKTLKSTRTGKYGDAGHMVELLCGRGRQFAAFGVHPKTHREYEWLGWEDEKAAEIATPLNTPWCELEAVSYDLACEVLKEIEGLFIAEGLVRQTPGSTSGAWRANVFDLIATTAVEIDGQETTWGEIRDQLPAEGLWGNLFREDTGEMGDSNSVHFYVAEGCNEPCAWDFARDCAHWEQTIPPQLAESLESNGALFSGQATDNLFTDPDLVELLENWVLIGDKTVRHVDEPNRAFALDAFKALRGHMTVAAPTKTNPTRAEPAVKVWQQHPQTLRADYAALRPDHADEAIFRSGQMRVFNTYCAPELPETGGEVETALEFVEHLIPQADQRELFLDWHAAKFANPAWRMHGLVMVTPAFGTGRGTWQQILGRLFGLNYVNEIPLGQLIGRDGQSQFNDFMVDSLIVCVPEALEEREDQSKWSVRHAAYEQLKMVCDPVAQRTQIRRKYGKNSVEWVFASLFICTNHPDALAIEPGDRRLLVLSNTETPLLQASDRLCERILTWQRDLANIGALGRFLKARWAAGTTYDPFGLPPVTAAKEAMIESGQSDMDRAYDWMLSEAPGDIVTPAQWRQFAHRARSVLDVDLPLGTKFDQALTAVIRKRARRPERISKSGLRVDGRPVRVWIIRGFERWSRSTNVEAMKKEVKKNGEISGKILPFDATQKKG